MRYRRGYLHIYETYKTTEALGRKKNNLSLHEDQRGVLGSFRLPFRVSLCNALFSRMSKYRAVPRLYIHHRAV